MKPLRNARPERRFWLPVAALFLGLISTSAAGQQSGSITGTVTDIAGALVTGAHVTLTGSSATRQATTDGQGDFSFGTLPAGHLTLAVTADGLANTTLSLDLRAGETLALPPIAMAIATASTSVDVTMTKVEVAETEIKMQERQLFLGFAPNFYVSYNWTAEPLTTRQKFELANKTVLAPINLPMIAGIAGIQQAQNAFAGYGQGGKGYAKRFGASYADFIAGTYLGGALLPTLFHQDPRYFYKGTGSKRSRALYALSTAFIARGDSGKWQPAYAGMLGDLGSAALSNAYYPASDRHGVQLTLENGLISIASDGVGNLLQEFFWRKLSSGVPKSQQLKP